LQGVQGHIKGRDGRAVRREAAITFGALGLGRWG